jgi:hypothetical protein
VVQVATHFRPLLVCALTGFNRPTAAVTVIAIVAQRIQAAATLGIARLLAAQLRVMASSLFVVIESEAE